MSDRYGIDILFSTHNGERTLPAMMAALSALNPPRRPWRIIAVDNASRDGTRGILDAAAATLPATVLTCTTPGKLPALQMALDQVRGDLVVFTDDDVIPDPDWLVNFESVADATPEAGLFGGAIEPAPVDPVSEWFEASRVYHAELYARTEAASGPVNAVDHIFGPNFMVRAEHAGVLHQVSGELGPTFEAKRARQFAMGEDTQIMELLRAKGVQAAFVAEARVKHQVRSFQTDLGFMLERAERHGRGGAIRLMESARRPNLRRIHLVVTQYVRSVILGAQSRSGSSAPGAQDFDRLWAVHWARGAWREAAFRSNAVSARLKTPAPHPRAGDVRAGS